MWRRGSWTELGAELQAKLTPFFSGAATCHISIYYSTRLRPKRRNPPLCCGKPLPGGCSTRLKEEEEVASQGEGEALMAAYAERVAAEQAGRSANVEALAKSSPSRARRTKSIAVWGRSGSAATNRLVLHINQVVESN